MVTPKPLPASWRRQIEGGGSFTFPEGGWSVSETIRLPSKCGQTLRGSGQTYDQRTSGHYGGTSLFWEGEPGGTMLRGDGTTLLTLNDLTLTGRPKPDKEGRAGILLHAAPVPGWGLSGWTTRNVNFIDADCGIQFGTTAADANCSDSVFERVIFIGCGTGFRVKNDQGLNFLFNHLGADGCGRIIDMERGGGLLVNMASIAGGGEIRFGPAGHNSGPIIFNGVRFEGGLKLTSGPYRRVELHGLHEAGPARGFAAEVTGSTLLIDGPSLFQSAPSLRLWSAGADGACVVLRDALCYSPPVVDKDDGSMFRAEGVMAGWGR